MNSIHLIHYFSNNKMLELSQTLGIEDMATEISKKSRSKQMWK